MQEDVVNALYAAEEQIGKNEQKENDIIAEYFKLYDREYSTKKFPGSDFPLYDEVSKKYYRNIPKKLSNEEFNALYDMKERLANSSILQQKAAHARSPLVVICYILASITLFCSFLLSVYSADLFGGTIDIMLGIGILIGGGVISMVFWIVIGKIIELLEAINFNIRK